MYNRNQKSRLEKLANDNFFIILKLLGEDFLGLVVALSKSLPEKRLLQLIKMNKGGFIRNEEQLQLLESLVSNNSNFELQDCSLSMVNSYTINEVDFLTRFGSVLFLGNVILGSPYEMLKLLDSNSLIQNIEFNGCGFIHNLDLSGELFSFSPYLESINILTSDTEFFKSAFKDINILDHTDLKKVIVLKLEFPLVESDEFIRKIRPHLQDIQILKSDPPAVWYNQMTKLYVRNFAELQSRKCKAEEVEQITFQEFSLEATKSETYHFDCVNQVIVKDITIQPNLTLKSLLENLFKLFPKCKHLVITEKIAMLDIVNSHISARTLEKITIMYSKETPAAYRANLQYYLKHNLCEVELIPMIELDSFQFGRYEIQEETLPLMRKLTNLYYQIENNAVGAEKASLMIELLKGIKERTDKGVRKRYNSIIGKTNEDKLDEIKGNIEEIKLLIGAEQCEQAFELVEIVEYSLLLNDNSEEALAAISNSFELLENQWNQMKRYVEQIFDINFKDTQFGEDSSQLESEYMDSSEEEEVIIEEDDFQDSDEFETIQDTMIETE
ncbi:predicted protein [Naegleria gruberi]|uniref:Predicted protein n=1 Tax=Naegleria gruberi TaxID=5762 RepID=D2VTS2_NAEGR|nr:uncharacterized protein NAEGRDRAFT_72404 [Naegleria gruberi]EFC39773.1 predicted protein [Naegleria gruberi]|eukprot:XP_002672517.1 predicted protein [Naegleria gruberi strain NEG-M]